MEALQVQGNIGIYNVTNLRLFEFDLIVEAIKNGVLDGHDFRQSIEVIRRTEKKAERQKQKAQLPYVLVSSLVQNATVNNSPAFHTGMIGMDFDWPDITLQESRHKAIELKEKTKSIPFVLLSFLSPSNALKVVCRVPADLRGHDYFLRLLVDFFVQTLGAHHDPSCVGIKRTMYLSYDNDVYYNRNAVEFDQQPEIEAAAVQENLKFSFGMDDIDKAKLINSVDSCIQQIDERKLDFAPDYHTYLAVCFALCSLGEQGRSRFHNVCRYSPKYNEEETDKKFTSCLKDNRGKIGAGTFFYYCNANGIKFTIASSRGNEPAEIGEVNIDLLLQETPAIPDDVFSDLPEPLKASASLFEGNRIRDLFLLSALTCSSCLFNTVSGIYDNFKVYCNLFLFVIAPAASGKSVIRWGLRLLICVIRYFESKRISEDSASAGASDKDKPIPTTLLVPGNSSVAGLIQLLLKNPVALLCETEADAVSKLFNVDFGDYSDKLRQIFHHEYVYSYRKTGKEFIGIPEPKLSVLLSGTPSQIAPLVRSGEDGLFSRFAYYAFSGTPSYRSPFGPKHNFGTIFELISEDIFKIYQAFEQQACEITLTTEQIKTFDNVLSRWQKQAFDVHGHVGVSVINRMGLILFKLAMVLTILRRQTPQSILVCDDVDFNIAIRICETLRAHSFTVFNVLPKTAGPKVDENPVRTKLYSLLPAEFKYGDAVSLHDAVGVSTRQLKRLIAQLKEKKLIEDSPTNKGYLRKCRN